MYNKIIFSICAIFFLTSNSVSAQTIGYSGPDGPIASGATIRLEATGETRDKYISSVANNYGSTNYYEMNQGLACDLINTYYYNRDVNQPSKFDYRLENTTKVAKSVKIAFEVNIITIVNNRVIHTRQIINYTVTILPALIKIPIYLIAGIQNSEYYLSLNDATSTPQGYSNRGIYYYAHDYQTPSTVPVYEFKGKSYDLDGYPSFPENITYYSKSPQSPTQALTGIGSNWSSSPSKVAFYAYSTQVAGTVPIYCYSHPDINLFVFTQNPPNDSMIKKEVAFYAFPVN